MVAAIALETCFSKGATSALADCPKQISTGDRTILAKSQRGIATCAFCSCRRHGCAGRIKNWERSGSNLDRSRQEALHHNVLAIALANKLAAIAGGAGQRRAFELTRTDDAGVVQPA